MIQIGNYVLAFYSATFAFNGVNMSINIVEEIKPPLMRNVIVSIFVSIATVTVFYLLANFAYLAVLTPTEILASEAVAVTFAGELLSGRFKGISRSCILSNFFQASFG